MNSCSKLGLGISRNSGKVFKTGHRYAGKSEQILETKALFAEKV